MSGWAGLAAELFFHAALAWAVVVVCGRLAGRAVRAAGQPPVIGEVLSGILLGPSLLGWLAPGAERYLFPSEIRPLLGVVARIGVGLYMFLVGLELDVRLLRQRTLALALTSQAAVLIPFLIGCVLGATMLAGMKPAAAARLPFVLFSGVALAMTAFPVLARILSDRGLIRTELGVAALTCAAVNDVMGWLLLAIVVGLAPAMPAHGVPGELAIAFALGVIVPVDGAVARTLTRWLFPVVTIVLLPPFFALTGLRTEIGLVSSAHDWLICAAIVAAGTVGKIGGTSLASRLSGWSWPFALRLGALMNTRGLMELIVLAVGLDAGIISPALFTMMVIMAIVTTAMTGPLLALIVDRGEGDRQDREERAHA